MKTITLCLFLAGLSSSAFSSSCLDFKKLALSEIQNRIQNDCRMLTGKSVSGKKSAHIKSTIWKDWDIGITTGCFNSCGNNEKCVEGQINDFINDSMNVFKAGITHEWCSD